MEMWNRIIMVGIGNSLGHFISLEDNCCVKEYRRVFKLLVELDLREGIPTYIDIEWGSWIFTMK
jgi:hypothetical protein